METDNTLHRERAPHLADQHALVERARRGDASAHRALYDAHVDRVYRLTYRDPRALALFESLLRD